MSVVQGAFTHLQPTPIRCFSVLQTRVHCGFWYREKDFIRLIATDFRVCIFHEPQISNKSRKSQRLFPCALFCFGYIIDRCNDFQLVIYQR